MPPLGALQRTDSVRDINGEHMTENTSAEPPSPMCLFDLLPLVPFSSLHGLGHCAQTGASKLLSVLKATQCGKLQKPEHPSQNACVSCKRAKGLEKKARVDITTRLGDHHSQVPSGAQSGSAIELTSYGEALWVDP